MKRVKRNVRIERGESMRSLKRRKTTVEGIDCHIKNPKCRFFTTVSGSNGDDDIWGFLRRDCPLGLGREYELNDFMRCLPLPTCKKHVNFYDFNLGQ